MLAALSILQRVSLGLVSIAPLIGGMAFSQPEPVDATRKFDLLRVSERAYAAVALPGSEATSNSGIVLTDKWVCVLDSHLTAEAAADLISEIKKITPLPIRYLVNSHFHADHTHGNQSFAHDVEVLSTHITLENLRNKDLPQLQRYQQVLPDMLDRMRKDLARATAAEQAEALRRDIEQREQVLKRIRDLELVLPGLTFEKSVILHTLEQEVHLLAFGRGHTDGDAVIWLPDQRLLFAGDLVFSQSLPNMADSYSKEWIDTLAQLDRMRPEVVVPGHGLPGTTSLIDEATGYLQELRRLVKTALDKNQTLDELVKATAIPARFRHYSGQDFFSGNLERVFREMREEAAMQQKATPRP